MQDFEKLGAFYLGKEHDLRSGETSDDIVLYDAKDLTTHAVCVGMTGSGKTGLCLSLLEEAGIDKIPAIVIDPKGDISNLLLTFPDLDSSDFLPWIDDSQATREGKTVPDYAKSVAKLWKNGLADWGQDGARIKKFRDTVDLTIYTPGSRAGIPLTVLRSFDAPPQAVLDDGDAFRERISAAASGLLALLGLDADPVKSREHILISKILEFNWKKGLNLDIATLIMSIQNPPFKKVGIMEIDKFYPEKDRLQLSMTMNNLLASPTFQAWLEGEPLDIQRMLYTTDGKPRISVMSIAHLSDSERMFFVTILLNEILSWMRSQAGTSSLRAILYMDEVFGYFPPVGNPPSKTPMLTLLKQARAFGLGCVLATQNPVDLDYKGLSNTGTWFLGRLQTERDKARVLEGLEGASASTGASFDRQEMEETLAGLGKRVFLMNNVHEDEPVVFHTRWALSYLRGPLTRTHIEKLMAEKKKEYDAAVAATKEAMRPGGQKVAAKAKVKPKLPKGVDEMFLEVQEDVDVDAGERLIYRPSFYAEGRLHFSKSTYKVDDWETRRFLVTFKKRVPDDLWDKATLVEEDLEFSRKPESEGEFADLDEELEISKNFTRWEKEFKSYLYRTQQMVVYRCSDLKMYSEPNEIEGDFRARLQQVANEKRDVETEKLRKKFAKKFDSLRGKIMRAETKIEKEREQYQQKKRESWISFGQSILGAVLGRKTMSSTNVTRASSSMRSFGRASKEKGDIARAEESLEVLQEQFEELENEFKEEVDMLEEKFDAEELELEELEIRPKKTDISIEKFGILWTPWRVDEDGIAEAVY